MALTMRDRKILTHIEKYNGITIKQAYKIFFNNLSYGLTYARKRLKDLNKMGILTYKKDLLTNQRVYMFKDVEKDAFSTHRLYLMDLYSNLVFYGADIIEFTPEQKFLKNKIRVDALIKFNFAGKGIQYLVEVDFWKKTDIDRLQNKDIRNTIGPYGILVISSKKYDVKESIAPVLFLDYSMKDFKENVLLI